VDSEKELSMEKRQHLWCICKETVINAVKHSKCSHVNINFDLSENKLLYNIEDNGVGFNKKTQPPGNGLTNISFRAEKLGAKYDVVTAKNLGVKFNFYLDV
jgi:signal transduction histidine kinase